MNDTFNNSALLSAVVERGQPWRPPNAPRDAWADVGCFIGPADALAAATALRQNFADGELLASGVCIQGNDQQLLLAPDLTADAGPLVAFRDEAGADPFAIRSGSRTLASGQSGMSVLRDFTTLAQLQRAGGELLLVHADQVPLLRLWGVPCARLGVAAQEAKAPFGKRLVKAAQELAEVLGRGFNQHAVDGPEGSRPASSTTVPPGDEMELKDPFEVTFVVAGWMPEWDERQASVVRDYLASVIDLMATRPALPVRLGVWLPSQRHQNQLELAWRMRNARAFRRGLGQSIATDLYKPARAEELGLAPPTTPPSMIDARETLERAGKFFADDPHLLEPYRAAYQAAIKREVTTSMLDSAVTADPIRFALTSVAADEVTGILAQSASYHHELDACIADPSRDPARLDALTRSHRQAAAQLIKLAKFKKNL